MYFTTHNCWRFCPCAAVHLYVPLNSEKDILSEENQENPAYIPHFILLAFKQYKHYRFLSFSLQVESSFVHKSQCREKKRPAGRLASCEFQAARQPPYPLWRGKWVWPAKVSRRLLHTWLMALEGSFESTFLIAVWKQPQRLAFREKLSMQEGDCIILCMEGWTRGVYIHVPSLHVKAG